MTAKQLDLCNEEVQEDWEKEWKDMPDFNQEDKGPFKQIIVSFKTPEDMKEFANLINQNLTSRTKSIWYPQVEIETLMDKRWTTNAT